MLKIAEGVVEWRLVEGEIVALDLRDSMYLAINASGADLWPMLLDGSTRPDLIAKLVDEYGIDEATAAPDVDAFTGMLHGREMLDASLFEDGEAPAAVEAPQAEGFGEPTDA